MIAANDNDIRWIATYESVVLMAKDIMGPHRPFEEAVKWAKKAYILSGYTYVDIDPNSTMRS